MVNFMSDGNPIGRTYMKCGRCERESVSWSVQFKTNELPRLEFRCNRLICETEFCTNASESDIDNINLYLQSGGG